MQDRPSAAELIEAIRGFLEHDVSEELTGRKRFLLRVCVNALGILEREWASEEDAVRAEYERLIALLSIEDPPPHAFSELRVRVTELNEHLAHEIRQGDIDERFADVRDTLYATVVEKLAIANPRWLVDQAEDASSGG